MGRFVPHLTRYVTIETPLGRALARRMAEANGKTDDILIAFTRGELGFFADALPLESDRAEVGRFLGRCIDCREPVAVPDSVVADMARWTGKKGIRRGTEDWRRQLMWWLRRSGKNFGMPLDPISDRQRQALILLRTDIETKGRRR